MVIQIVNGVAAALTETHNTISEEDPLSWIGRSHDRLDHLTVTHHGRTIHVRCNSSRWIHSQFGRTFVLLMLWLAISVSDGCKHEIKATQRQKCKGSVECPNGQCCLSGTCTGPDRWLTGSENLPEDQRKHCGMSQ